MEWISRCVDSSLVGRNGVSLSGDKHIVHWPGGHIAHPGVLAGDKEEITPDFLKVFYEWDKMFVLR
jgi:hypothetical protein